MSIQEILDYPFEIGDLATWFTGTITFLTLLVTSIGLISERRKLRKMEERHQASQISAWTEELDNLDFAKIIIQNSSNNPVYDIIINIHPRPQEQLSVSPIQEYIQIAKPGKNIIRIDPIGGGMFTRASVEMAFRDSNNLSWVKNEGGHFHKLKKSPTKHYNLIEPLNWKTPETI